MTWTNPSPRTLRGDPRARPRRPLKWLVVIGGVVLVAAAVARLVEVSGSAEDTRMVGRAAPAFELPDVLATPARHVSAQAQLGHVWVLHAFGTWCGPCNQEHGALVRYAAAHRLPVVGVAQGDEPETVRGWLAEHGNPYSAVAADIDGDVGRGWSVKGVPQYFVIDATGIVRASFYGPLDEDELAQRLGPWLASAG